MSATPPLPPVAPPRAEADAVDLRFAEEVLERTGRTPDAVIPVLQALQDHYGYLPRAALEYICRHSQITPAAITGVATFYDMFRHEPVGRHVIHVCHGTACHVGGAERVEDALRRHLRIPPEAHTDPERQFTLEPVACLGCCTLAPVVRIEEETFGFTAAEKVPGLLREFLARAADREGAPEPPSQPPRPGAAQIQVCLDSCCVAKGTDRVFRALHEHLARTGAPATVKRVGCVGACYRTPMIEVVGPDGRKTTHVGITPEQVPAFVEEHFTPRRPERSSGPVVGTAGGRGVAGRPGPGGGARRDRRGGARPGPRDFPQRGRRRRRGVFPPSGAHRDGALRTAGPAGP